MVVIASLTLTLTGAVLGALVLVAICVRVEERHGLPYRPPNQLARIARRMCGLRISPPSPVSLSSRPPSARRPA